MWELRRHASLLIEHGHPAPSSYPIRELWEESNLAMERQNALLANQSMMNRLAIQACLSEDAGKEFDKQVKGLING